MNLEVNKNHMTGMCLRSLTIYFHDKWGKEATQYE